MRTAVLLALLLPVTADAAPAFSATSSDTAITLVELYTSEGCSSCPPADRWLRALADDQRLWREFVPVAFHVDYWDDLGWPDPFASARNSARQRSYRDAGAVHSVYTPGFVVRGHEWRGWFARETLPIDAREHPGVLSATVTDGTVTGEFAPTETRTEALELHVAILGFDLQSWVKKGENQGRRLDHDFTVIGYAHASMPKSGSTHRTAFGLPTTTVQAARRGLAVWVSRVGDPTPIQAIGGWFNP